MRAVWLAERDLADADAAGVRPRPVTMHFVEDRARDRGRNNLPTANEVVLPETSIWSSTTRTKSTRNTGCKIYQRVS